MATTAEALPDDNLSLGNVSVDHINSDDNLSLGNVSVDHINSDDDLSLGTVSVDHINSKDLGDQSEDAKSVRSPTYDSPGQEDLPDLIEKMAESMATLSTWMSRSRLVIIFFATVGLQLAGPMVTLWMIYLSCFVVGKAISDYLRQEDIPKPWKYVGTITFYMALVAVLIWVIAPLGHFSALLGMAAWPLHVGVAVVAILCCGYALYQLAKHDAASNDDASLDDASQELVMTKAQRWSKIQGMTITLTYAGLYIGQVFVNTHLFSLKGIEILGLCMMVCCCAHLFFEIYEALQHKTQPSQEPRGMHPEPTEPMALTWQRALCCCMLFSVPLWCVPAFQNGWMITIVMATALWSAAMLRAFVLARKDNQPTMVATRITITVSYFFSGVMAITLFGFVHHLLGMVNMSEPVMWVMLLLLGAYVLSYLVGSHDVLREVLHAERLEQDQDILTYCIGFVCQKLGWGCAVVPPVSDQLGSRKVGVNNSSGFTPSDPRYGNKDTGASASHRLNS